MFVGYLNLQPISGRQFMSVKIVYGLKKLQKDNECADYLSLKPPSGALYFCTGHRPVCIPN